MHGPVKGTGKKWAALVERGAACCTSGGKLFRDELQLRAFRRRTQRGFRAMFSDVAWVVSGGFADGYVRRRILALCGASAQALCTIACTSGNSCTV